MASGWTLPGSGGPPSLPLPPLPYRTDGDYRKNSQHSAGESSASSPVVDVLPSSYHYSYDAYGSQAMAAQLGRPGDVFAAPATASRTLPSTTPRVRAARHTCSPRDSTSRTPCPGTWTRAPRTASRPSRCACEAGGCSRYSKGIFFHFSFFFLYSLSFCLSLCCLFPGPWKRPRRDAGRGLARLAKACRCGHLLASAPVERHQQGFPGRVAACEEALQGLWGGGLTHTWDGKGAPSRVPVPMDGG